MSKEATTKVAKKQLEKIELYQRVFSSTDGRAVLDDLMQVHWITNSTFDPNQNILTLREGERNVVLRIMSLLKMNTKKLHQRIEKYVSEND